MQSVLVSYVRETHSIVNTVCFSYITDCFVAVVMMVHQWMVLDGEYHYTPVINDHNY